MSKRLPLPSREYLLECLSYDPMTGNLKWNRRPRHHFSSADKMRAWNNQYKGKPAFTCISNGYRSGKLDNVHYLAHRIIFKILHDLEPDMIDHDDGNRSNNTPRNLKASNNAENQKNKKLSSANISSGVTGISWHSGQRQWMARIKVNGKTIHLGYFDDLNDAKDARKEADQLYGFNENHGRIS